MVEYFFNKALINNRIKLVFTGLFMKIENNRMVTLNYRLTLNTEEGELIEETFGQDPLKFIYGRGMMLDKFEEHLHSLQVGDTFNFGIPENEAYGKRNEELVLEVTRERFGAEADEKIPVGEQVKVSSPEGGTHVGQVVSSDAEHVYVDFNPPMAGKHLHFTGEILAVAAAPAQE